MKKCNDCEALYEDDLEVCPDCMAPLVDENEENADETVDNENIDNEIENTEEAIADENAEENDEVKISDDENDSIEDAVNDEDDFDITSFMDRPRKPLSVKFIVSIIAAALAVVLVAVGWFFYYYPFSIAPKSVAVDYIKKQLDGDVKYIETIFPGMRDTHENNIKQIEDEGKTYQEYRKEWRDENGIKKIDVSCVALKTFDNKEYDYYMKEVFINYPALNNKKISRIAYAFMTLRYEVEVPDNDAESNTAATSSDSQAKKTNVILNPADLLLVMSEGKWYVLNLQQGG